ncbi:MAG TPA: peptidylprolyl isomerase, partial [Longimicrobiales bacterium]
RAEDARARTPEQLRTLMNGTRSRSAAIRAISIRALGRLQRPGLADSILTAATDRDDLVRAEMAMAIARAYTGAAVPARYRELLLDALARETDSQVVGAFAEALGLLRHPDVAAVRLTASRLIATRPTDMTFDNGPRISDDRLGIVRGLYFLARQPPALRRGLDTASAYLVQLATRRPPVASAQGTRIRTVAAQTIALAGLGDSAIARTLLEDPDPLVRREGVALVGTLRDTASVRVLNARALGDGFWMVRHDALRQYATRVLRNGACSELLPFARDARADRSEREVHVRLAAIELMAGPCSADAATIAYLDSVAGRLRSDGTGWHAPARALLTLAAKDPAAAARRLPLFVAYGNPFVRTHAAAAAGILRDIPSLRILAGDRSPNVRTAAVQGLARTTGHAADSIYTAQLALDDSQLLMAAAAALNDSMGYAAGAVVVDSTRYRPTMRGALDALDRVTKLRSETSRDGRMALLTLIGSLPAAAAGPPVDRLTPYLRDFDEVIAAKAADLIGAWTGTRPQPAPQPLSESVRIPTFAEAQRIARATYVLELATGDTLALRLFPFEAPVNAARFAQQAADGWFDGLTLHRVEPSFVVQGGSPGANEYAGARLFSRDELARPNWRGTIGLSTRGHDTGDSQIYFNAIDNVRLDPSYTVFGELLDAAAAADDILEGTVIRRVRIR